nr:MAG TPA: hypothetical protein [Caudoviricetes sp.]
MGIFCTGFSSHLIPYFSSAILYLQRSLHQR